MYVQNYSAKQINNAYYGAVRAAMLVLWTVTGVNMASVSHVHALANQKQGH